MKHKKRLSDLEKRVGAKNLTVKLLKYTRNIREQEEALIQESVDIIVWYYSDTPPEKWSES